MAETAKEQREQWLAQVRDRQRQVVDSLRPVPEATDAETCLGWTAVERQAATFLRHLQPQRQSGKGKGAGAGPEVADHARWLEERLEQARVEVASHGSATREAARAGMGLRLAVMGKGGAGKTFISSVLARSLARQGRRVLAVDLDTNPGLALSLGMAPSEEGLPCEAVEERPGAPYGWNLAEGLSPSEAVESYAEEGPDGVRFLGLGKIGSVDKEAPKRSMAAVMQILLGFGDPGWDVVADMEAGPTTPFERYHSFSDEVLVVVGPAWRSAMTARRLLTLVGPRPFEVISNRFRDEPDHPGLDPRARIPFDPDVVEAERRGLAPLDACPDAPAVTAVRQLAERHLIEEVPA
ncbi:MAG: nucleotide-binding protein [Acidimicrobiales bacterium]